jgi:PhnB protein
MLLHRDGISAIAFYKEAFGATELARWTNDNGTVHVAEMSIDGAVFHLREESTEAGQFSPATIGGTTCIIELFVEDPYAVAARAVAAGAHILNPVRDYEETGYRQGTLVDPFGHRWSLLRKIQI